MKVQVSELPKWKRICIVIVNLKYEEKSHEGKIYPFRKTTSFNIKRIHNRMVTTRIIILLWIPVNEITRFFNLVVHIYLMVKFQIFVDGSFTKRMKILWNSF